MWAHGHANASYEINLCSHSIFNLEKVEKKNTQLKEHGYVFSAYFFFSFFFFVSLLRCCRLVTVTRIGSCHVKRSLMAFVNVIPNYDTNFSEFGSAIIIGYILRKSVSYQKKDGRGHACPSFFWYDNDSGHQGPFCVTPPNCKLTYVSICASCSPSLATHNSLGIHQNSVNDHMTLNLETIFQSQFYLNGEDQHDPLASPSNE